MKIRGTDFILFLVSNLHDAARFYREDLNLNQTLFSEEYQWADFDCGNVTLALKGGEPTTSGHNARLALAVDDIQAVCAELVAKGTRLPSPPQDHGCCQHIEVRDPDGNVVILHHRTDGTYSQTLSRALASLH